MANHTKPESILKYMDPQEAVRAVVKDYGVERLASKLGKSASFVYNKIDPNDFDHPLLFTEAIAWPALHNNSTLPVQAWAHQVGGLYVPLPNVDDQTDDQLYRAFTQFMDELGDFTKEFNEDMRDGRITTRELARLKKLMGDVQTSGQALIGRIEKKAERR